MPEQVDVVVVGAGHAGLAASWQLAQRGVSHVVLEAGRIGESWRSLRWDSFQLNTPTSFNRLPGEGPDLDPGPADGFLSGSAWADRLVAYAARQALPVRTGVSVTGLRLDASGAGAGPGFVVDTAEEGSIAARAVVVASGMQRVPRWPAIAADLPPDLHSIHTAAYRSADLLPPGGVLVVGCAQSGGQVAEDLLAAGRRTVVAACAVARIPRRYRGRDIFDRLADIGWWDMVAADLPDPRMTGAAQPIISGVGRYGHTLSLQGLLARGAELTGRLVGFDGPRARFAPDLAASIRFADGISAQLRSRIDAQIERSGMAAPPPDAEPDPDDVPMADPDAVVGPGELDLVREGIGTVIWATGFGPDLAWGGRVLAGDDGRPAHEGGRGATPGIWFLGVPWMRSRSSGIVLGADRDGAAIADAVVAHLGGAAPA